MTAQLAVFYLLAGVAVASAAGVVTRRSPVHAALMLVVTFGAVAGIYILLEAEFLAAVQVLVYAGGIMVLFLFVILLVDLEERGRAPREPTSVRPRQIVYSLALAGILVMILFGTFSAVHFGPPSAPSGVLTAQGGNLQAVAMALMTDYVLPFELASVLLLVAMVGAIVLAKTRI